MAKQDSVFFETEGDNWFKRNATSLANPAKETSDYVLKLIRQSGVQPKRALEIGCANGWRLGRLHSVFGAACTGIEPSVAALEDGRARYPEVDFRRGTAAALRVAQGETYDLVIISFVFHWVSRENLLAAVAEADRVTAPGGHLLLADFLPDQPTKRPYHHRTDEQLFTYKQNYAEIFVASHLYAIQDSVTYNQDTMGQSGIDSNNRAACFLLRKAID